MQSQGCAMNSPTISATMTIAASATLVFADSPNPYGGKQRLRSV
jgi:hypothetical protein